MTNLKDKIKNLPKKPGVYIFKDGAGKIIYIGKALSLKHRVANYFQPKNHDLKTQELIANIDDLETFLVNSEFEALLLEAKLIKQHQPKYNVNLKDDKSYLYIAVGKENPERIFLSRKAELKDNVSDWYGPFTTADDARQILKILRRIFPFRSCKTLLKRPCLYQHLRLCPGVCLAGERDSSTRDAPDGAPLGRNDIYRKTVVQIRQILSGKTTTLIKSLEKEMKSAAKTLNFEKASGIKHKINALQRLTQGWQNVPKERKETAKTLLELRKILVRYQGNDPTTLNRIEGYDVSNLSSQIIVGGMVAFINGEPDKSQYRKFNLKYNLSFQDDPEGIRRIVRRRLNHPEWLFPQLILIDGGKTQVSAAFSALKEKNLENQVAILGLIKEEEAIVIPRIANQKIISWKILRLSRSSQTLQLLQRLRDESHRFAQKYYKTLHQKIRD